MTIEIKNLVLNMIIGIFDYERNNRQDIHFDISILLENNVGSDDKIENTLDYNKLIQQLVEFEHTEYFLLETLVNEVAKFIVNQKFVKKAKVAADKGKIFDNVDKVVVSVELEK